MQIKNLSTTELPVIVDCLVRAFEGYFVKMPSDVNYWRARFQGARVDFALSFGVFDEGELVAFIINGVDENGGKRTAFNTGTGVLPSHRGQALVDKMYEFALPKFREAGIEKCMLEVIQDNARAIRVYERIGFHIKRNFLCFGGEIEVEDLAVKIEIVKLEDILQQYASTQHFYCWDFCEGGLFAEGTYEGYAVKNEAAEVVGHFILNPKNKNIAQLEASTENFAHLMAGIQQIRPEIRMNNVDDRRMEYVQQLQQFGLKNSINQYEMEWGIVTR